MRRLVLDGRRLRNLLLALGFLGLALAGGGLFAGREEYRTHEAVGAARFENGILKARHGALRERAAALLGRLETLDSELSRRSVLNSPVR